MAHMATGHNNTLLEVVNFNEWVGRGRVWRERRETEGGTRDRGREGWGKGGGGRREGMREGGRTEGEK